MEKAILASTVTALHPLEFMIAVKGRVAYKETEKEPDMVITILLCSKKEWQFNAKYKAGRMRASHQVIKSGDACRSSKKKIAQNPAVAAISKRTSAVLVDGCWYWGLLHLQVHCSQLREKASGRAAVGRPILGPGFRWGPKAGQGLME